MNGSDARRVGSVALLAAAALAYQLLLMRLMSVLHWYPFAAIIVSLALLGHGISGSLLALCADWARPRFRGLYVVCAAGFGLGAPLAYAAARELPFNGLELIWAPRQLANLAALYLLLSLPFLSAAGGFGLIFLGERRQIPRYYAADLCGAGLGAVAAVALLQTVALADGLRLIGMAGLLAAALAVTRWRVVWALLPPLLLLAWLPAAWLAPASNSYKGLSAALRLPSARIVAERSGALGLLQVVASPQVPLRHAPGRSLRGSEEPAEQRGLFTDGDGLSAIARGDVPASGLAYLAQSDSALPYRLLSAPRVLLLGLGGGAGVLQALRLGAQDVQVVELDARRVALLRDELGEYSGGLLEQPRVRVTIGDARSALRSGGSTYSLIVLPRADSAGSAGGGAQAAADSFLYTVEALREARRRLSSDGWLIASRWEQSPPRDALKLLATVVAAWRADGVADPAAHLALIRSWQTHSLLAKRSPLTPDDIATIAGFCAEFDFEPVYLPGRPPPDELPNDDEPWPLAQAVRALLGPNGAEFTRRYPFDIAPAVDARPFFHNFFRWAALPELWRLRAQGGAALLDSGYLVLAAALVQALLLSLLLILGPLWALPRGIRAPQRLMPALYFLCLGLGFLFVEMAALSRLQLFLGAPLLAATLVLAVLLGGAGLGSAFAQRLQYRAGARPVAALAVVALLLAGAWLQAPLLHLGTAWPLAAKAAFAALLLLPLAVAMGMPFPLGLARLDREAPAFVPWAWGLNGCASVLAALLAVLLAIEFGYDVVWLAAAGCYGAAALVWRGRASSAPAS